uniref:Ig-like domain-containing protein n=1 Tax=Hippocampus comes TaxID=109280 RepID=A0A3Q2Z763_HIPCM
MLWNSPTFLHPTSTAIPLTFKMGLKNQEAAEGGNVTLRCELSRILFEEKPQDVRISEGEIATLSCTTSDFTTPVTWRRNHIPLRNGDKFEIRKEGKVNLLLIHAVEPGDAGVYSCDTGDAQASAKLTVTELPPFFQEELQSTEEGGSVSLYCELSKPGVPVQWKKNRLPLKASRKFEMKQDGSLLQLNISDLEPEDGGRYTCQAGSAETIATLSVRGAFISEKVIHPNS